MQPHDPASPRTTNGHGPDGSAGAVAIDGAAPRIGVYVCHCGTNIAATVDVEAVKDYAAGLGGVALSRDYKYMCADPGQELIKDDIKEHGLNRIVVASCSPCLHEITFRNAIESGGLNPYQFQMVNIREHVSWVHKDKERATEKARDLVRAAIRRVGMHHALTRRRVDIADKVMVVGGGIAGIHASLMLAKSGKKVYLVEREASLLQFAQNAALDAEVQHGQAFGVSGCFR